MDKDKAKINDRKEEGRKEKHGEWKESWRSGMIRNGREGEDQ